MLTTSYPRSEADVAGSFVRDIVAAVRAAGAEVEVVSPAEFRHFGIAYGHGIVGNLRRRPWLALALPLFLAGFVRAARRAARSADVVHAHWLPSGLVAALTGKPYVLQVWGTDLALAGRVPFLARRILRRAPVVVAASTALADRARSLGARDVRVVPPAIPVPGRVAEPDDPPHVLYVGRLSPEKGILDFLEASEGMPRVIVGDGPLRARVPEARGFVPPAELGRYFERAAVVCVPSRREGFGMVAREAMAYGRPVVASAVGGLTDDVIDGETGRLVPAEKPDALRAALTELLEDYALRRRLGEAGRARAARHLAEGQSVAMLLAAYEDAARGGGR